MGILIRIYLEFSSQMKYINSLTQQRWKETKYMDIIFAKSQNIFYHSVISYHFKKISVNPVLS